MSETKKCRGCGAEVPLNAPFGHCVKCLLELGFGPADSDKPPSSSGSDRLFGDYELIEQIGRGGMGVVFKARQLTLNRVVALKMIAAGEFAPPEAVRRFQIEAEAAAKLHHPNIVPIHEFGVYRGQQYFSMEYVDGETLAHEIRCGRFHFEDVGEKKHRASERERQIAIARLMEKVAASVDHAHQQGILHRDLKPGNILLDGKGEPHLTDFGLAKILEHEVGVTRGSGITGTPYYIAPEQVSGKRVTKAADVYSLGVILYEVLTLRPPFLGATTAEILRQIADEDPIDPRKRNRHLDAALAVICLKCLEKEPNQRYASAAELAAELGRWLRGEPTLAQPAGVLERGARWVRRNRLKAALISALVTVALLGSWLVYNSWQAERLRQQFGRNLALSWEDLQKERIESITLRATDLAAALGRRLVLKANAERVVMGIYTDDDQILTISQLAPFVLEVQESMSGKGERPVQIDALLFKNRALLESKFTNGLIDVIRIGEGPLVRLRRINPRITPLVEQVSGGKTSVIFVARSSPIYQIEDLVGKKFAAGSPTSTSSGLRLLEKLLEHGLHACDLTLDFGEKSEGNYQKVLDGRYDAGIGRRDKLVGSLTNDFRVLAEFPTTMMPWAGRAEWNSATAKSFIDALVGLKDPKILENLPNDPRKGFKACDLRQFEELDNVMKDVEEKFFGRTHPCLKLQEQKQ